MGLKLENILKSELDEKIIKEFFTIGKSDMFKDYVPITFFQTSQPTEIDLNGTKIKGEMLLSNEDYESHINSGGNIKDTYTFTLRTDEGKDINFKIQGRDLYDPSSKTVALRKDKTYSILLDDTEVGSEETEVEDQDVSVDDDTFNNLDNDLKDLKSQASRLSSIKLSDRADDPNFRRSLVLNFANSNKTNIKINGESLFNMLKKLSDDKIVEKNEVKWTDDVSTFFNNLFKLFSQLHKCCKENKLYLEIKKFLKNLYEILKEIRGNYKDQKKRDQVFTEIVKEMSKMISYLSKVQSFKNKGQKAESLIKEEKKTAKLKFVNFNINPQRVSSETEEEVEDLYTKKDLSKEDMERLAFKLYGKDAGKFFPRLSFKHKDIKTLFGLLGKGGIKTSQEKMMDKYGIYNLDFAVTGATSVDMDKLPKYQLQFNDNIDIRDEKGNQILRIKSGDKLVFNFSKNDKILIHKTSSSKYGNVSQIHIDMLKEPKKGDTYDRQKIIKIIPVKGPKFAINPKYKVNFKVLDKLK